MEFIKDITDILTLVGISGLLGCIYIAYYIYKKIFEKSEINYKLIIDKGENILENQRDLIIEIETKNENKIDSLTFEAITKNYMNNKTYKEAEEKMKILSLFDKHRSSYGKEVLIDDNYSKIEINSILNEIKTRHIELYENALKVCKTETEIFLMIKNKLEYDCIFNYKQNVLFSNFFCRTYNLNYSNQKKILITKIDIDNENFGINKTNFELKISYNEIKSLDPFHLCLAYFVIYPILIIQKITGRSDMLLLEKLSRFGICAIIRKKTKETKYSFFEKKLYIKTTISSHVFLNGIIEDYNLSNPKTIRLRRLNEDRESKLELFFNSSKFILWNNNLKKNKKECILRLISECGNNFIKYIEIYNTMAENDVFKKDLEFLIKTIIKNVDFDQDYKIKISKIINIGS